MSERHPLFRMFFVGLLLLIYGALIWPAAIGGGGIRRQRTG